jgi:hypothetical protein
MDSTVATDGGTPLAVPAFRTGQLIRAEDSPSRAARADE